MPEAGGLHRSNLYAIITGLDASGEANMTTKEKRAEFVGEPENWIRDSEIQQAEDVASRASMLAWREEPVEVELDVY